MGFEMPEQSFYRGRCVPVPLVGDELQQFKHKLIKAMHSSPDGSISLGVVSDKELEQYKQDLIRSISKGADNMEDVPMNIRQLEEKGKDCERLAEPEYYAGNGLSPLEAFKKGLLSREETIGFIKGNIIKYVTRAGHKHNASEDMVKAIDYCGHLKRLYENEMRNGPHFNPNLEPITSLTISDDTAKQAKEKFIEAVESIDKVKE